MGAGHSLARNVAEQTAKVQSSVVQNYIQSCGTSVNNNTTFAAKNCGNYHLSGINIDDATVFNTACLSKISSNTQLQSNLAQTSKNTASALTEGMGIQKADAENFSKNVADVGQNIQSNFSQQCQNKVNSNIGFYCDGTNDYYVSNVTINNSVSSAINCSQDVAAVTSVIDDITQQIENSATAKSIGPSFDAMLVFFIVMAIAACFILYYGEQFMIYLIIIFVIVAILAVVGFLIYAKVEGIIPFKHKT